MEEQKLAYAFSVEPTPGGGFTVWFPELPRLHGWAERLEDVGTEAATVARLWLEMEAEQGHPIPLPGDYEARNKWPQGNRVDLDEPGQGIGAPEAAVMLNVSLRRVHALAQQRGVGRRFGNYWVFTEDDINRMRPGKRGRPATATKVNATAG